MIKVRYSTNNSGGHWWLSDKDWKKLEKKGWKVKWISKEKHYKPDKDCPDCNGTGKSDKYVSSKGLCFRCTYNIFAGQKRHLGVLARECEKDFESLKDALQEFEKITGQKITDEGCGCCGPPHTFWWGKPECFDWKCKHKNFNSKKHYWTFASGEDLLQHLHPDKKVPKTLREAVEKGFAKSKESVGK
jgi:hypothetical protein